jgi:hypothetical protein
MRHHVQHSKQACQTSMQYQHAAAVYYTVWQSTDSESLCSWCSSVGLYSNLLLLCTHMMMCSADTAQHITAQHYHVRLCLNLQLCTFCSAVSAAVRQQPRAWQGPTDAHSLWQQGAQLPDSLIPTCHAAAARSRCSVRDEGVQCLTRQPAAGITFHSCTSRVQATLSSHAC